MDDYLVWKENRATEEQRPDNIARQYRDRVAFTVTQTCRIYCRHFFQKELVVDGDLKLNVNVDEGLDWIAAHTEVRDVLITGGDPFLLSDDQLEYLVRKLRKLQHIEMIRFGTPVEKGAELIRDTLRGHTTGLAQPIHVIATNIGTIPLMPNDYITGNDDESSHLRSHKGEVTTIPNMPE